MKQTPEKPRDDPEFLTVRLAEASMGDFTTETSYRKSAYDNNVLRLNSLRLHYVLIGMSRSSENDPREPLDDKRAFEAFSRTGNQDGIGICSWLHFNLLSCSVS